MSANTQKAAPKGAVAAIGNFDGVHRGHQALIDKTKAVAAKTGAPVGVIVFDPHPRRFFRPDDPPFLLTTPQTRDGLLRDYGVEVIFTLKFDKALSALSPTAFVETVLRDEFAVSGVVTGPEFRFGAARAGDVATLREAGAAAGIEAHVVDTLTDMSIGAQAAAADNKADNNIADNNIADDGNADDDNADDEKARARDEKIGSSLVRAALRDGDAARAAALLGRRWSVSGVVEEGQKLGRTIGFATANITLGPLIEPRYGVYCVTVKTPDGRYNGVANFGRRPTVGAPAPLLEAHLFDFSGDLYGREITVSFAHFIRPEMKFDGIDALKAQIAKDSDTARRFFSINQS